MTFVSLCALMILIYLLDGPLLAENHVKCGTRWEVKKSFQGEPQPSPWPWQVSIEMAVENRHFCGGAIINEFWIITAAHCFMPPISQSLEEIVVVIGLNKQLTPETWVRYSNPRNVILHNGFDEETGANDLALVRVSERIIFGKYAMPVCFPNNEIFFGNTWLNCRITGWMKTGEDTTDSLQDAPIKIISFRECNTTVFGGNLQPTMMCMEFEENERIGCHLDSGGPLVCKVNSTQQYFLIGVVSWITDYEKRWPGVFTVTKSYLNWVEHITGRYGKKFNYKEYGADLVNHHHRSMIRLLAQNASTQNAQNHSGTSLANPGLTISTSTKLPQTLKLTATGNIYTASMVGIVLVHLRSLLVTILAA
ncbi:serine protease 27-like [Hemiscyllium ocellatum]|uniref:serine protease 27-like n=1 Tax=Hemiscyllium ocellatum TaxID=170820 RepID=UPI002965E2D9|nr:serine protease 27-like [Hemiscyllium ocellatum]